MFFASYQNDYLFSNTDFVILHNVCLIHSGCRIFLMIWRLHEYLLRSIIFNEIIILRPFIPCSVIVRRGIIKKVN